MGKTRAEPENKKKKQKQKAKSKEQQTRKVEPVSPLILKLPDEASRQNRKEQKGRLAIVPTCDLDFEFWPVVWSCWYVFDLA